MAAGSGARADVRPINLIGEQPAAEDDAAASITLSRFGGDTDDPSALIFDRKAMPAALADGLPSALAEAPGAHSVSPYDFFADVIDVTLYANAQAFAPIFTPSLNGRFPLTGFLWASNAFFEPSGNVASRHGWPFFAAAASQTLLTQPMPRLSGLSPSSARPSPSGAGVWDEWSCVWKQPLSDPWKQTPSGPC
jgi:hypothetical protein